ncbi:Uncharacterized protein HA466_0315270 [Hirschfeldia incana]|nr:Uncharacterized protein HA466_0315270 [Hirschfeldia incana]
MDAWEDGLDRKTRVKTTGSFFDSNNSRSFPDIETPSCGGDTTVFAKPVSDRPKESVEFKSPTVTSTQLDRQVNPKCSLSLGLRSYPPIEKSPSLSLDAKVACTSFSRPVMAADNVNSVNLRIVKSEVNEDSAINRVKEEVVGRFRKENSTSSGSLNPVDSRSLKAEPNNFIQSKVFDRKDGTLFPPRRPLMQSNEILDILASFTPNQKDTCLPHPSGINNAPMSMTEDKTLDDCKTSPGTNGLSISGEEKVLSGKEAREESHSYEFGPDCGNGLSRVLKKQVEKRNLYDNEKVKRSAAMFAEGNRHAEFGGSETEQRVISVPFDGDNHHYNHVEEKESQASLHDNISPVSYKADISTIDYDPPVESSDGSQSRIKTLDASDSFVPLRVERDRLSDFSLEQRKYLWRESDDESYKFSRERYIGKTMRSPRSYVMPDRRRFSDNTESNLQDRDSKNFESNNYGNTRRGGGGCMSNSYRGRRPGNDEESPFPHSFTRRQRGFSFTQRGSTDREDASAFHGFRDGEKFTRGVQSNDTEPMFMSQPRPYQGRFARGRANFSNNHKRGYPEYRSRSPVRSRERSAGPSSSFRNRSQEDFSGHADFSHRRSPSGYRMGRMSSPEHSGYPREMVGRRHDSPPYSHRPNAGRGRGYKGRGYARGRGYGRDGTFFRKPYDRVVHRNHGDWNNLDPRERVDYSDDFFDGPVHSERFGVDDGNVERRQFGYRHDCTRSFRQAFNSAGCAPTNLEDGSVRYGQDPDIEMVKEQGIDGKDKTSTENASGRTRNMEEEESSKYSEVWQRDELGGGDGF